MINDEYQKLLTKVKDEITPGQQTTSDFYWDNSFLTLLKDANNKKAFVEHINFVTTNMFHETFDKTIDVIEREYIKIQDIPSSKVIFDILKQRIASDKSSMASHKKELVELKDLQMKEKDYDKLEEIESKIWWAGHHLDRNKDEIQIFEFLIDCLKSEIRCHRNVKNKKVKSK
jgi:hypothetical protein